MEMAALRVDHLRRDGLPENVETTVAVERGLLLHEFPALFSLVVEQHLKATLAGSAFVSVVRAPELFDAVLPLIAHASQGSAHKDEGGRHRGPFSSEAKLAPRTD
jgi:hypothetical protein